MENQIFTKPKTTRELLLKALFEGTADFPEIHVCLADSSDETKMRLYIQNNLTEVDEYIEVDSSGTILIPDDNDLAAEMVMRILEFHNIDSW
jgi:hypothetical protein